MNQLEERIRNDLRLLGASIPNSEGPIPVDSRPTRLRRIPAPVLGFAAMAIVTLLVGGVSVLLFRGSGVEVTSGNEKPDAVASPEGRVDATIYDGSVGLCSDAVTRGTMYLGGPASGQNLAEHGFLFSLPADQSPADVATAMVSQAIVGVECDNQITGVTQSDTSTVSIVVVPPAAPSEMRLVVDTLEADEVVGVTRIQGSVEFEVTTVAGAPALQLLGVLPDEVASISVRFRKGDDVWELAVDPSNDPSILMAVPPFETDRFPDAQPEWVLFTLRDADGAVLDAGGALVP